MADRRTPRSLQGLFKFCVEATKKEDAQESSQFQAMTDEDKAFINSAIKAVMGNDPVKLMLEKLQVLMNESSAVDDMIEALEEIQMQCEDLDLANDFHKIGGYQALPHLLEHKESELRWRAADLVATLVQNNPYSQQQVLSQGYMALMLGLLDRDENATVKIKLLYAVSCLSRDFLPAQEELFKNDGFSTLLRSMQINNEKLQTKAAFLISYLCSTDRKIQETLYNMGCVEMLCSLLQQPHSLHHEHLLSALSHLTTDYPQAISECHRPELRLQQVLQERVQQLKDKEEYQEAYECACTLLNRCFPASATGADAADR